jgi:hypothetical protein
MSKAIAEQLGDYLASGRLICSAVLLAGWLGNAQPTPAATTNATIPYKTMEELCRMADGVDSTKLLVRVVVTATNRVVAPSDIRLTIQSASQGPIPVHLVTNGQVLNFPHQKELSRENPPIVANQPKGTLSVSISFQLALPDALTFRYARLADGVAETNKLIKEQAGLMSFLAPKVRGVIFIFPETSAGKAKVTIAGASGHTEYVVDAKGQVRLKLEKSLVAKNPEVQLSEKPLGLLPDIE